jgi:hypothetical protein
MAIFSSTIGTKTAGDPILVDDINHLFLGVGAGGMDNAEYNDDGFLVYFETMGREVTLTYSEDGLLTKVSCFFASQNQTVEQNIVWSEEGVPVSISSPIII